MYDNSICVFRVNSTLYKKGMKKKLNILRMVTSELWTCWQSSLMGVAGITSNTRTACTFCGLTSLSWDPSSEWIKAASTYFDVLHRIYVFIATLIVWGERKETLFVSKRVPAGVGQGVRPPLLFCRTCQYIMFSAQFSRKWMKYYMLTYF